MSGLIDFSKFDMIESEANSSNDSTVQEEAIVNEIIVDTVTDCQESNERDKYLIDLSKTYPKIEYLLKINGIPTFPKGNLQAIKAKAKQGKTHVNICLMTGLLTGKFIAIESLIDDPKICYFSTEEHISSVANNNKKIHQLCGWDTKHSNDKLLVYSIRDAEVAKRVAFIEQEIAKEEPDLLFLDGLRDILLNFNNIEESNKLISWLMRLSGEYNCDIVCVLHTNKSFSDDNMRGHLGTELLNKSSDVLEVEKRVNNIFVVNHTDSRNRETGKWAFCFDEEGLLKEAEIQDEKDIKAGLRIAKMEGCFSKILTEDKHLSFTDLRNKYMPLADVKTDAANKHIREMADMGFLKKREDGKYELA